MVYTCILILEVIDAVLLISRTYHKNDHMFLFGNGCKNMQVYGNELKNKIERFIQKIKDRTECFDDHFLCRKNNCNIQHVYNWFKLFFVLYLHVGMNRIRFMKFILVGGG